MFSRVWKDPVWSAVIAAILFAIGAGIWASVKGAWPTVGAGIARGWTWLGSATDIQNWLLLALFACTAILVVSSLAKARELISPNAGQETSADWRDYRLDRFLGLKWRWSYAGDGDIVGLGVFCIRCDYQIRPETHAFYSKPDQTTFTCDECHHKVGPLEGSIYDIQSQVERKIQKHLRNEDWPRGEA